MRSIKLNTKENRILNSKEMNVISGGENVVAVLATIEMLEAPALMTIWILIDLVAVFNLHN